MASLDQAAASLVASEGDGETFSVEPIPHLAKLASNVATDPSAAALLLSSEALSGDGKGRRGRYLRDRRLREVAEQRARVLEAAAASTATPTVPTTQRLIDEGVRGFVDGIEIILSLHHERRSKYDTEELARRWLSEAKDQVHLANALRNFHFWGRGQKQQQQGGERGEEEQDVFSSSSEENQRRREIHNHEGRQRAGWAKLLRVIEAGGDKLGRERGDGDADAVEGSGLGSCAFDLARFSVSPNGKKILIHKPHEMVAVAEQRGGGEAGLGEGCISALLGYISVQPEVHYVTARKKSVTMNLAAAWVTQSGVEDYTGLWNDVRKWENCMMVVYSRRGWSPYALRQPVRCRKEGNIRRKFGFQLFLVAFICREGQGGAQWWRTKRSNSSCAQFGFYTTMLSVLCILVGLILGMCAGT